MTNFVTNPALRSELMARIRSKNTSPELLAFSQMRKRGVYFQRHYSRAPGSPDLARPRKKLAVFIDGDFWHGRELARVLEKHGPGSPWVLKLEANVRRDRQQDQLLEALGWQVLRVWESDLRKLSTREAALDAIERFLRSQD